MHCSWSCANTWRKITRFQENIISLIAWAKREVGLGCQESWLTFKGLIRRINWRLQIAPIENKSWDDSNGQRCCHRGICTRWHRRRCTRWVSLCYFCSEVTTLLNSPDFLTPFNHVLFKIYLRSGSDYNFGWNQSVKVYVQWRAISRDPRYWSVMMSSFRWTLANQFGWSYNQNNLATALLLTRCTASCTILGMVRGWTQWVFYYLHTNGLSKWSMVYFNIFPFNSSSSTPSASKNLIILNKIWLKFDWSWHPGLCDDVL